MASYYACCIPKEYAKNGINCGWAWVKAHESEWIACDDLGEFVSPGYNIGEDFFVKNNTVYSVKKTFCDIDSGKYVIVGMESIQGCDLIKDNS